MLVLFSALTLGSIVCIQTQPAEARTVKCKLTTNCVYGSEISDRWIKGARFEQKADFQSAIIEYKKAFKASEKLTFPGKTQAQMKLLRACASTGSYASLQGAIAGAEYMKFHQLTAEHTKAAIEISRNKFREVSDAQDEKFPELAGSCP
ncbi:hypothetical protein [Calothrix sp. PCC 6303]|nr:hypothetical protein [Calothrix sp. PCC 6303]